MKPFSKVSITFAVFCFCLIVVTYAGAYEWVLVSDGKLTMTYADRESLSSSEGDDLRKVWMKMLFKNDNEYDYFLDLYEYECANKRYRVVKGATYNLEVNTKVLNLDTSD